jgi:hypothetical protein
VRDVDIYTQVWSSIFDTIRIFVDKLKELNYVVKSICRISRTH